MIKRLPWLRMLKKTDPEPPVRLPMAVGPLSNGEGWWPDSPRKALIRKLVLEKAEEVSRRERIDRREFLASACGMATTLYMINVVNGCAGDKKGGGMSGGSGKGSNGSSGSSGGGKSGGAAGMTTGGSPDGGMSSGGSGGRSDGGFNVPADAMTDPEIAKMCLGGGGELIIDMQTHFTTPESDAVTGAVTASFLPSINLMNFPWLVRRADGMHQTNRDAYVELIMNGSDTTVGVLSGIAYRLGADGTGGAAVLTNEALIKGVDFLGMEYPKRMLSHCMVMPNDRIDVQLAMMDRNANTYTHWKTYPPWGSGSGALPEGYWLDGMDDPDMVGPKMIERGLMLGAPIFCIHKGFPLTGFSPTYTNPRDVGPAANMFPDAYLVIYHSAFEHGLAAGGTTRPSEMATAASYCDMAVQRAGGMWPEGPYDEEDTALQEMYPLDRGSNSLIKSLRDANIGPNGTKLDPKTKEIIEGSGNSTRVYAELGGVVPNLMTGRIDEAMHFFGKMLKHIGEDRIVWGTDCLWFGSPQPVIEAFRCFEISDEFQEKYGYPALTQEVKEKILGQNSAKMQRDGRKIGDFVGKCHDEVVGEKEAKWKRELDEEFGPRRDMITDVWGPRTRREFLALHEHEEHEKRELSGRIPPLKNG